MNKVITISYNKLSKTIETKNILVEKLINAGFQVSENIEIDTKLIISIGGDGSFLNTMHKFNFPQIPVVALNTGHLGFFAEISPDTIDQFIEAYKNKEYFLQEVDLLEASIFTKESTIKVQAIN